jgi:hypothetical protein
MSEAFRLVKREAERTVDRAGRLQCQRFGQIPEQLIELPHDREHVEHLLGGSWGLPPVVSAEGDLGNLLPRAEAVINCTTSKAPLPEAIVNAAAEVRLQVEAGLAGVFVNREVNRSCEGQRNTAQAKAVLAVSLQTEVIPVGERS